MNKKNGFTLIETSVVMSIFGFMISAGLMSLLKTTDKVSVKNAEGSVLTSLEGQRSKALGGAEQTDFGVKFNENSLIIFRTEPGFPSSEISFPEGIKINAVPDTVTFKRLLGSTGGTSEIEINGSRGSTARIFIKEDGSITSNGD